MVHVDWWKDRTEGGVIQPVMQHLDSCKYGRFGLLLAIKSLAKALYPRPKHAWFQHQVAWL